MAASAIQGGYVIIGRKALRTSLAAVGLVSLAGLGGTAATAAFASSSSTTTTLGTTGVSSTGAKAASSVISKLTSIGNLTVAASPTHVIPTSGLVLKLIEDTAVAVSPTSGLASVHPGVSAGTSVSSLAAFDSPRVPPGYATHNSGSAATSLNSAAPTLSASQVQASTSVQQVQAAQPIINGFSGVNEIQQASVSQVPLEPPDMGMGVGQSYVINFVNVAFSIYSTSGALVLGPVAANQFFNTTDFLSDPRVNYDAAKHAWIMTILDINMTTNTSSELIAVTNGSPLGSWHGYSIPTTDPTGAGCPCFGDYPIQGYDAFNLYVSASEFPIVGNGYNGQEMWAMNLGQLIAGDPSPNLYSYPYLSNNGAPAYHIQPAVTLSPAPAEYFMSSLDPNSTSDNRLGVWQMTNRTQTAQGVAPILSEVTIHSEAYSFPPNAQTPAGYNSYTSSPTTGVVNTDFDAMQEVEYLNGHLYGALNTGVNVPSASTTLSGIAWFDVVPSTVSPTSIVANISSQGYIAQLGEYLLYPHIEVSPNGTQAIVFGIGGPNTYLSAAYVTRTSSSMGFSPVSLAQAGVYPDNGFTGTAGFGGVGRWGDYSAGAVAPNGSIWLATQYIPNNGDVFANWGSYIFNVN
ncbi:MAG: hypothetical protein HKL82_08510 [Acidimicrobiaceae bacterium]|nr:hypothetical protein [Acidimicrobiaceae bacterium]